MSTKLKGFVELPIIGGGLIYIRSSSIDAIWGSAIRTYIQTRASDEVEVPCTIKLGVAEVLALIAAAQDG